MSVTLRQETVTVPMKHLKCDRCGIEVRLDQAAGFVCCRKVESKSDELADGLIAMIRGEPTQRKEQHLCHSCWSALEAYVRGTQVPA